MRNSPYEPSTYHREALSVTLLDGSFIGVNFSKLTHNNQIFRNDFVCNHYHLCKLSAQTIECKIFTLRFHIVVILYLYLLWLYQQSGEIVQDGWVFKFYSGYFFPCNSEIFLNFFLKIRAKAHLPFGNELTSSTNTL